MEFTITINESEADTLVDCLDFLLADGNNEDGIELIRKLKEAGVPIKVRQGRFSYGN